MILYRCMTLRLASLFVRFVVCMTLILGLVCPPAWAEVAYPSTRGNFGNDVIYYIVVDRFFDGESGNNVPEFAFADDSDDSRPERLYKAMNRLMLNHM